MLLDTPKAKREWINIINVIKRERLKEEEILNGIDG